MCGRDHVVCTNGLCTASHSYQGMVRMLLKSNFPVIGQGPALPAAPPQGKSQACCVDFLLTLDIQMPSIL